ncbi:hypothetical protein TVAG_537920 [Trichomonas vaginalis G3]|uniref:DUF3447 domain-containing protein n=1 Tax=Trichomonas vaginalis (strain ATCC PRA-98 / G3) TaxID=412133 RepID=A2GVA8_TRIV3|nr:protein ubiquitination [Trichomonas vaginalis G3]EAX78909.1 hypothetical protein TVAG_537920 [Trichomonas vaginalis G3]KAI5493436.1 protein ubiquitination [Trichomonas vaginalis G3]|eukprot:XP_001291839.1 hypothetical protein [Trichomonas vaginalis G3]
MSSSGQLTNESEYEFNNLTPIEVFKYPSQASKIIWEVNSNNILESSSQIIDLIKSNKIKIHTAIYLIDNFSEIRDKDIKLFAELYLKLSNEFSYITKPENKKLAALLHYKGFKFEKFVPKMKEEEILNIYSTESPLYYIAWDKVDDLKNKFPKLDDDLKIDNEITPLDCSIKYGSELCFSYLKNLGAVYTDDSQKYAVQGGNRNIFMQMIEDGESFDRVTNIALDYHNFEIADYLKSNFRQTFGSIAESMRFGNYDVASYLLSNREDINKINDLFLFIFIIAL